MTKIEKPDFQAMTGPALVQTYNEMVVTSNDLGIPGFSTTKRFASTQVGVARAEKLHNEIVAKLAERAATANPAPAGEFFDRKTDAAPATAETTTTATAAVEPTEEEGDTDGPLPGESEDDMAKRKAAKKAKGGRKTAGGDTIKSRTEAYNALVPAAKRAGVKWAKHHTSLFESHASAEKATKRLEKAIKDAK